MNIPSKVKVAGYTYDVLRPKDTFFEDAQGLDGSHQACNQCIKVAQVGTDDYQNTVFLHELLHAIIYSYTPDEQDEKFVEQVSKGLYQVIKDNPEIFESK